MHANINTVSFRMCSSLKAQPILVSRGRLLKKDWSGFWIELVTKRFNDSEVLLKTVDQREDYNMGIPNIYIMIKSRAAPFSVNIIILGMIIILTVLRKLRRDGRSF